MDFIVNIGVRYARARKFFQPPKKRSVVIKPQAYLISRNNTDLFLKLSTDKDLENIHPDQLQNEQISNSRIIFDAETLAFTEIINMMELHKNKQNSFRIKPARFDFFIGSDSSTEKGEVGFIQAAQ